MPKSENLPATTHHQRRNAEPADAQVEKVVEATMRKVEGRLRDLVEHAVRHGKAATILRLNKDHVVTTTVGIEEPSLLVDKEPPKLDPTELKFQGLLLVLSLMDLKAHTDEMLHSLESSSSYVPGSDEPEYR